MFAASNGACPQCIVTLLESGADINAVDNSGKNALHWVIDPRYTSPFSTHRTDVKLSESRGVVKCKPAGVCKLLLERGCNPGTKTTRGACPLRLLPASVHADEEQKEILRVLLDHMSEDCVTSGCLGEVVLAYLKLGDFDAVRIIEGAGWPNGRGRPVSVTRVLHICRAFPVTDRLADEVLDYFTRMIRFAERQHLIHLSEAEERDKPSKELRHYLLSQEAKVVEFIKERRWMFPRLFPTTERQDEAEMDDADMDDAEYRALAKPMDLL